MPVFACAVAVALDVADELAVGLACGVESETGFNLLVLEVTIDGLGAANHLYAVVLGRIVLGQHTGIGIGVVSADDYQCLDAQLTENLDAALKLGFLLQLGATRTNDIETAGVAILVDELIGKLDILVVDQAAGTHQEAVKLALGIEALDAIVESADYIVSAGCLSAGEDDAHAKGLHGLCLACLKGDDGHAIGVGEHGFDLFLVTHALCGSTCHGLHGTLECLG